MSNAQRLEAARERVDLVVFEARNMEALLVRGLPTDSYPVTSCRARLTAALSHLDAAERAPEPEGAFTEAQREEIRGIARQEVNRFVAKIIKFARRLDDLEARLSALERAAKEPAGQRWCSKCGDTYNAQGLAGIVHACAAPPPSTPQAETGRDLDAKRRADAIMERTGLLDAAYETRDALVDAIEAAARAAREAALREAMAVRIGENEAHPAEFWNGVHAYARAIEGLRAERERGEAT